MKSDIPSNTQAPRSINKWDFVVYFLAFFVSSQITILLCDWELHNIVLLSASGISIGNAVYYGMIWKDLKKSSRLGLAIFFSIVALIGFLLYRLSWQIDKGSQWDFLVELFGGFVIVLTVVFIYKHKTPSFWNWG